MSIKILLSLILCQFLFSCSPEGSLEDKITFPITNLSDQEYPDNPDIGFRATNYKFNYFTSGTIRHIDKVKLVLDMEFTAKTGDSISLSSLDLSEFIPTIPEALKKDSYLSYISCVNQEWNRNQVKFLEGEFVSNDKHIVRIDLARNCLNAYLWEIIVYVEEDNSVVPYAHGWFDFPHELYGELFELKNKIEYAIYKNPLENWVDPESKQVKFSVLRKLKKEIPLTFEDQSDKMYPLQGARLKKFKEIIYPTSFNTMHDLQSDSTLFATFSQPGFYTRKDPRTTELGRIYNLKKVEIHKMKSKINNGKLEEIKLIFKHKTKNKITNLTIGGLDFDQFPVLSPEKANSGWKNSMGIGNHTFYEDVTTHNAVKALSNPYYAMLTDQDNNWLDSHKVGLDGPIFHFADDARTELHIWLLSFERHALVGHYVVKILD
jgi:hypothetical protein